MSVYDEGYGGIGLRKGELTLDRNIALFAFAYRHIEAKKSAGGEVAANWTEGHGQRRGISLSN